LPAHEDIHGTEVYGVGDKKVGDIDHMIIDKTSGVLPTRS